MIFQKIYSSKRFLHESKLCLDGILKSCSENNPRLGVTGLLLSESGHFFQVLEGKQQSVETLYEKICWDPRHTDIVLIADRLVPKRMFPEWSMAFREIDTIDKSESCFELTRLSVMNGPIADADDEMRAYVMEFLARCTPQNRGAVDFLDGAEAH